MGLFTRKSSQETPRRRQVRHEQDTAPIERRYAFRRSHTLTGSISSHIDSVGSDVHLKSPRERAHELAEHRSRLLRIFGLCLLVIAGLSVFMWQFMANVSISATNGIAIPDEQRYSSIIQEYLAGRPTERFRGSLDTSSLLGYLVQRLPEIERIHLASPSGLATSNIELTMRQPVAGWNIGASQQFVDASGVAFERNYYEAPRVQIIDDSGIPADSGVTVASGRFLSFVGRVVAKSKEFNLGVVSITIPSGSTRQLEVRYENVPYPVKLSVDRPVGEQVEDTARTLAYISEQGVSPEYVDVRVSRRAYYR